MKTNQMKNGTSMFSVRCSMLNLALAVLPFSSGSALAGVRYVDVNSTNATPPYTNWATATTNIQAAVDAAVAGDEIVVTNGTYRPVYVDQPLCVRSVNGPQSTEINGYIGRGSRDRCVFLRSGASLSGFSLCCGYSYDCGGG